MRFGLDFTIVMSSICNLNDAMNCCQDFFTDFWVPHREKSTVVSLLCFVHPGSENNRLNRSYWIILRFNAFLIESIEWKILHLLVCFELHRDVFIVTSIFGLPTIWLKPVLPTPSYHSGGIPQIILQYEVWQPGTSTGIIPVWWVMGRGASLRRPGRIAYHRLKLLN
jgi:hypothetical protein